jgi:hypothetical protein
MALTFDPTDPARMTPEQRVDELAAILATGVQFERNLHDKANDPEFTDDIAPLLDAAVHYDPVEAVKRVRENLLERIPGDPWRGEAK